jgi:hypothetical protein
MGHRHLQYLDKMTNEALTKIKQESDKNSQVMKIVSYLSNLYGSTLMGAPNYARQYHSERLK